MSDAPLSNDQRFTGVGQMLRFSPGEYAIVTVCSRCDGRGYHHGFGEHGHDPDWCERCGGAQYNFKEVITPWET